MTQLDLSLQPVHNAATTPITGPADIKPPKGGKPRAKATRVQGVQYITTDGWRFTEPKFTVDTLLEYSKSYYGGAVLRKINTILFTGDLRISVEDPQGKEDDILTQQAKSMAWKAGLWRESRGMFSDASWWGAWLGSPEWQWIDNVYTLTNLIRLPPESFADAPTQSLKTYNELLHGITLGPNNTPEYYQTVEGVQTQITNIIHIKAPDSRSLAGDPVFRNLLIIFAYLKHCWESVMRTVNRAGSPVLFIRVTDGNEDDFDFAEDLLRNWGPNTAFQLRGNMDLVDPKITEPTTPLEAINILARMVVDYFSPANFVQNPSATLSSSDVSTGNLMDASFKGLRTWVEDACEEILLPFIQDNGYEDLGYKLVVSLPSPETDRSDMLIQVVGNDTITKNLKSEECRAIVKKILGSASDIIQDLTPEELAELEAKGNPPPQLQQQPPALGLPFGAGSTFVQNAVRFYDDFQNAVDKKKSQA